MHFNHPVFILKCSKLVYFKTFFGRLLLISSKVSRKVEHFWTLKRENEWWHAAHYRIQLCYNSLRKNTMILWCLTNEKLCQFLSELSLTRVVFLKGNLSNRNHPSLTFQGPHNFVLFLLAFVGIIYRVWVCHHLHFYLLTMCFLAKMHSGKMQIALSNRFLYGPISPFLEDSLWAQNAP